MQGRQAGRGRLVLSYLERLGPRCLTKQIVRDSRRTSLIKGGGLPTFIIYPIAFRAEGKARLLPLARASVAMTAPACACSNHSCARNTSCVSGAGLPKSPKDGGETDGGGEKRQAGPRLFPLMFRTGANGSPKSAEGARKASASRTRARHEGRK